MALQLEEQESKEEQTDDHRLRVVTSPSCDKLGTRDETPPSTCPVLCGPRTCATLPPTLGRPVSGNSEPKKRRLWGLRGLVKMFRRKTRRKGMDQSEASHSPIASLRTRSASELAVDQSVSRSSGGPYNQGLSVSHDSVFSPESPTEDQHTSTSNLALATRGVNMVELKAALRRRRTDDSGSPDYDHGLIGSPPMSPNTLEVLSHGFKNSSRATQSSCSDASMLSMGSFEYDEESFGSVSHHSSRASLIEGRNYSIDNEPEVGTVTLSHNAARHKMAVRPRRTRAISRYRKQSPMPSSSLPTTIEVNEESIAKNSASVIQETLIPLQSNGENLTPQGEYPSRDAVEALVVELVTEKSKNFFSRSVEEKRSSCISSGENESSRTFVSSQNSILMTELSDDVITSTVIKERNKSDPTSFCKRINVRERVRPPVSSQRASSLEGFLDRSHDLVLDQVLNESQFHVTETLVSSVNIVSTPVNSSITRQSVPAVVNSGDSCITVNSDQSCKIILPKPNLSDEQTKKLLGSLNNRESRSSIDNLTTTLLPGIYIRPFSPTKNIEVNDDENAIERDTNNIEINSPNDDARFSKTNMKNEKARNDISNREIIEDHKLQDDLQDISDTKVTELKNVNREQSFTSQSETKVGKVPEFMRVQLNRVKSFNSTVVLNTNNPPEKESLSKAPINSTTVEPIPINSKPKQEVNIDEPISENKAPQSIEVPTKTNQTNSDNCAKEEQKPKEEIVLRRPSLIDKSVIMYQATSMDNSNKNRTNQPELFKVFARRSFKMKENEVEDSKLAQNTPIKGNIIGSDNPELRKEEKPIINPIKRYSIGSPMPFGTKFADTNITPSKTPLVNSQQHNPATTKSQPISIENSSKICTQSNTEKTNKDISLCMGDQSLEQEIPSKLAFSRRSFSHVAMKPIQGKPLSRTSSANQSDCVCKSVIINKSITTDSSKVEETTKHTVTETKPVINTKPIVWPPARPCTESSPNSSPIDISIPLPVVTSKPLTIASNGTEVPKISSVSSKNDAVSETIENKKVLHRFISEAPHKVTLAEAKNTSFTKSMIVDNARKNSLTENSDFDHKSVINDEPSSDWRLLVRKRREDRLKHTKSMDADEILLDTRPNSNRSSKVLEMANNFQKLQVA